MTFNNHHPSQSDDFSKLDFTLWSLQREYAQRHEQEVNRTLSERPRERAEGLH